MFSRKYVEPTPSQSCRGIIPRSHMKTATNPVHFFCSANSSFLHQFRPVSHPTIYLCLYPNSETCNHPSKSNYLPRPTILDQSINMASPQQIKTTVTDLLKIKHPVMLAGMNVAAGPKLAAAVTNAGGLGVIGGVRKSAGPPRASIDHKRRSDIPRICFENRLQS